MSNNEPHSRQLLRSYVERLDTIQGQIDDLKTDQRDILAEAKSNGFSPGGIRRAVKRKRELPEDRAKREELEAITELYLANLGMLGGTPLGDAARKRLNTTPQSKPAPSDDEHEGGSDGSAEGEAQPPTVPAPEPGETIGPEEIAAARERGHQDAAVGKGILANPYVAGDPRRAAWDEGHCEETGSDGMDLPEAWRPKKKPKKGGEG